MTDVRLRKEVHETPAGSEFLIWLEVPKAGGDGMLLGVVNSAQAADAIVAFFQRLIDALPALPKVRFITPQR